MARRGGRRGRRSRSRQNRSRRSTRSTRSRRTTTRRSAPSSRRNTRGSGVKNRGRTATKARGTTNTRGTGAKNRGRTGVNASRGRAPTSRRQATRTTRQSRPTRTNTRVAQNQGPSTPVKNYGGNMGFERDFGAGRIKNVRPKPGFNLQDVYGPPTKTAMLSGDNMGGPAAILGGVLTIGGMGVNAFKNMKDNFAPKLRENIEKKLNPEDVSSTGIGNYSNLIAAADPTALSGLGIGAPKATGFTPTIGGLAESLGLDPRTGQEVGTTTAGGLNIGGNFGLSAEESDRLGRVFNAPTNNKMLSEGGNLRMSDMFEADTQGAKIAKGINFVKNKIPLVNKLPDMKINSVAEEAQRQYLGYNPNLPASALARMDKKGKGGGTKLPLTPTIAQEVAPQYQPVPSESTTPTTQTGVDPNRLLQIQQQAYAQAYNPMLIGGFNPQFRFGAATPTIDYSTYFNY